ncbi:TIGR00282 family metallophosphoesterase [Harryflintia acetispora]|uniref:TIGR00282 family metallophosphoesterase n=1 Tax=Harryflintia acetispora TaxID=1849041 RepID=UPI00189901E6|nr:TIGR00282 family metallophosphoesterase [Harryflintia acetispora]
MRVMMIGDVVGRAGCERVRQYLPSFKRKEGIDFVIANGENSAEGNGILPHSAKELLDSGCDVLTTGNHALRRREIYDYLESTPCVIRPYNYDKGAPGGGMYFIDHPPFSVCVINLQGTVYLDGIRNPFDAVDEALEGVRTPHIILDFHAEATSEKLCMGHYLDGRVSLVAGTHTHVPTADARILPGGTGYVTDLGMCGGRNSVLGVKKELALHRMRTHLPTRFENDPEDVVINAIVAEIDNNSGKTTKIYRIDI